jgi:hypothetical protein
MDYHFEEMEHEVKCQIGHAEYDLDMEWRIAGAKCWQDPSASFSRTLLRGRIEGLNDRGGDMHMRRHFDVTLPLRKCQI